MPEDVYFEEGVPISRKFGDVYFSKQGGVSETTHVFINGNRTKEKLMEAKSEPLVIGELGFGSGLNLFVSLSLWQSLPSPRSVQFISLEGYPLSTAVLWKLKDEFPEIETWENDSVLSYRDKVNEFETMRKNEDSGSETKNEKSQNFWEWTFPHKQTGASFNCRVYFGDILNTLPYFPMIDCWYLDGFSPKKNPEMWTEAVFELLRQKSKRGTTLASFTSAGFIRRALSSLGFEIQKHPGYGRKREMIIGNLVQD